MSNSRIIVFTIIAFFVVGALVIGWSVYKKSGIALEPAQVIAFTDENFQEVVVEASKSRPVLVDFYADWCFPCRLLDPILEELAKDFKGRAVIGKVNTETQLIARRFGIQKLPTVVVIRDSEIKKTFFGVVPKETMEKALKEFGA